MTETTIPIIDIGPAVEGRDLGAIAKEAGDAVRTIGFMQVVGHGIDVELFHSVHERSAPLWTEPTSVLEEYRSPIGHPFRGMSFEVADDGTVLRQGLQNQQYDTPEQAADAGYAGPYLDFFGGNVWPPVPGLQEAMITCREEAWRVAGVMMNLFAVDLGLGDCGFAPYFDKHVSYFASLNYPRRPAGVPGEIRSGAHSDSGALTMPHQRGDYEGLQVQAPAGEWVTMPVIDEALVCNVGDLMGRWTNDTWPATPHRVIGGTPEQSRSSIAMHHLPNVDSLIEPLPSCVPDGARSYDPVRMYDWNDMYFAKKNRVLRLATAS